SSSPRRRAPPRRSTPTWPGSPASRWAARSPAGSASSRSSTRSWPSSPTCSSSEPRASAGDERRLHHGGRQRLAPALDGDYGAVGHVGRQEGQRDAVAERGREVAAGDLAHRLAVDEDPLPRPRRAAALGGQPPEAPGDAALALGEEGVAPAEPARLVPG